MRAGSWLGCGTAEAELKEGGAKVGGGGGGGGKPSRVESGHAMLMQEGTWIVEEVSPALVEQFSLGALESRSGTIHWASCIWSSRAACLYIPRPRILGYVTVVLVHFVTIPTTGTRVQIRGGIRKPGEEASSSSRQWWLITKPLLPNGRQMARILSEIFPFKEIEEHAADTQSTMACKRTHY